MSDPVEVNNPPKCPSLELAELTPAQRKEVKAAEINLEKRSENELTVPTTLSDRKKYRLSLSEDIPSLNGKKGHDWEVRAESSARVDTGRRWTWTGGFRNTLPPSAERNNTITLAPKNIEQMNCSTQDNLIRQSGTSLPLHTAEDRQNWQVANPETAKPPEEKGLFTRIGEFFGKPAVQNTLLFFAAVSTQYDHDIGAGMKNASLH